MELWIDKIDFGNLPAEKFWSFSKNYNGDKAQETKNMIFSGDYLGSEKKDGHYSRFVKDENGKMSLQGRNLSVNGEYLNKIGHVPHLQPFFNSLPNGTCLIGEIYFLHNSSSKHITTIMGCKEATAISRQKEKKLSYYIFDIWAWNGFSFLDKTVEERTDFLMYGAPSTILQRSKNEYVKIAQYLEGENLWEELQTILEEDGEGVVITKKGTKPEPGKRPARKTLKIKKEISNTLDCIFTGHYKTPTRLYTGKEIENWKYWENIKNGQKIEFKMYDAYMAGEPIEPVTRLYFYGFAGSIEIGVVKGNKVIPVGFVSGVSDEIKEGVVNEPTKYKGRPCEISCMEIDTETHNGFPSLRHPKFIQFRDDLTISDCNWEKSFGNI